MAKPLDKGFTFVHLLKACAKKKDLCEGMRLHDDILKLGLLERNPYVASTLISMYSKCGRHANAQRVLDELSVRNVVAWNALIAGHTQQGQGLTALNSFEHMRIEGVSADVATFICILKASVKAGDIDMGRKIHEEVLSAGMLEKDIALGTALVDMYAKFGKPQNAFQVLEELPHRDVISWNALVTGYVQEEQAHEVLNCLEGMQIEGICPDAVTFICILKACGSTCDIERGKQVHEKIEKSSLLRKDVVLGTTLVDMYAKCGMLAKARDAFDGLHFRTVVGWNVLIAGYCQDGQGYEALNCLQEMENEGIVPDEVTFLSVLKACGITRAVDKGKQIHDEIARMGLLKKNIMLVNALIDMYAEFGMISKAHQLVEELSVGNVGTFNALLAAYAQHGRGREALDCFEQMLEKGHTPDVVTFISILKACGSVKAMDRGVRIHDEIMARGFLSKSITLGNALVDMYAKCNLLAKAQEVLEQLPVRDVVSWNALISGYAEADQGYKVLECFDRMQTEGHLPDPVTFLCVLKACGSSGAVEKGKQIHDAIVRGRMLENDIKLATGLVDMYAKCGMLARAQQIHKELPIRDVVSWNVLIRGHVQRGHGRGALECFEQMESEGIQPDAVTLLLMLSVCGSMRDFGRGELLHEEVVNRGLQNDRALGNAAVDMYAKCGLLDKALDTLKELPDPDVVSWSALIAGYAQQDRAEEAIRCFHRMRNEGLTPDIIAFVSVSSCCGSSRALRKGKQMHCEILSRDLLLKRGGGNSALGTALIDAYGKCGALSEAREVLEAMDVGDVVAWNAMISSYVQHGEAREALQCLEQMESLGMVPDAATLICGLTACGSIGAMEKGHSIHEEAVRRGLAAKDARIGASVVGMYAKQGRFARAKEELRGLELRENVVCWNALLAGYAKRGLASEAMESLEQMKREGLAPDPVTFLCVLSACFRAGMLREAQAVFESIRLSYGAPPSFELHSCIVAGLARTGRFDDALAAMMMMMPMMRGPAAMAMMMTTMRCSVDPVWIVLLPACRKWGNVELARWAFDRAICS